MTYKKAIICYLSLASAYELHCMSIKIKPQPEYFKLIII